MCYQSWFKWWRHLHYWRNKSQRQLNIENVMQTFGNLLLQTYTFTKWKLILCNIEDNNNDININNNNNNNNNNKSVTSSDINSWICFTFLNVFSVKYSELHVQCSFWLNCVELMHVPTRNNKDIKSIFGADIHHVPGLRLLGIGGTPYISHKIMAQKQIFIFSSFSLKPPADGASYYVWRFNRPRQL